MSRHVELCYRFDINNFDLFSDRIRKLRDAKDKVCERFVGSVSCEVKIYEQRVNPYVARLEEMNGTSLDEAVKYFMQHASTPTFIDDGSDFECCDQALAVYNLKTTQEREPGWTGRHVVKI